MYLKILKGTIFGGITIFLLGWLIYWILLMDFNSANMNSCANKPDGEMIWWAMILSNLFYALLLTLVLRWSGARGMTDGLKTGAIVGFLFGAGMDFGFWAMTTMIGNFPALMVDVIVTTLIWSLTGLAIVLLWGKEK